ncbi:MAG: hypothetical protein JRF69_13610 [Deltaproteobacteria bacterium]|nr:hypothetical protein [Deltaproteobacteria bacterium]
MKKWLVVALGCVSFLFMTAASSFADITAEELLQILIEKGIVTKEDIEKAKASREPAEEVPEEKAEVRPEPREKVPEDKVVVEAGRKPKRVNIKGRVQPRFTTIQGDADDLRKVTRQNAFETSEFDGFSIRRARLSVYGEVIDKWKYKIQISADGAENADNIDPTRPDYRLLKDEVGVKLQDAYITYDRMPYFNVTGGQFKSRFSPSYVGAGPLLPLCERPLVVDKLAPKRDIGISIESAKKGEFDSRGAGAKTYDKPVFYAVGLYNGNGMNNLRNDNEDFMVTAMLLVRPAPYINFGVSYAYNKQGYDYDNTVFGLLPELTEDGDFYVYRAVDSLGAREFNIWDVNSAFDAGRVHIQAEYMGMGYRGRLT